MVKVKILELSDELSISCRHMNLYFQNRLWEAECSPLKGRSGLDLLEWLPYVEGGATALRFQIESSADIVRHFPRLPTDVRWLEASDTLLFQDGEWWPRLFLLETLRKIIIHRFRGLNVGLHGYVIGGTRAGRVAAAALAGLGFTHIHIVDEDAQLLTREVAFLKRYLLGISIEGVHASALTVQTQAGSLMLNTVQMAEQSSMLNDLSYFNFMSKGGVVVDISGCSRQTLFLQEAERADLNIISGLEVQSQIDVDLLSKIVPGQYITFEDYYESFCDNFAQIKNSPSV